MTDTDRLAALLPRSAWPDTYTAAEAKAWIAAMDAAEGALFAAGVIDVGGYPAATPAPLDVRGLIVLLERLMYAQHYGGTLADHTSVMPGDRVDTCTDSPCPEVHAAIAAAYAEETK